MWPNFSQQRGFSKCFYLFSSEKTESRHECKDKQLKRKQQTETSRSDETETRNETTQLLRITSSATSEGQRCFSLTLMMEHEKTVLTTSCAFVLALLWQSCQQRTFLHSEIYSQSFLSLPLGTHSPILLKERWSSTAAPKRLHNFVYTNPQRIRWVQMRSDSHSEYLT